MGDVARALEASCVHLHRPEQPPLSSPHRIGFFTHSVVGNSLLLLTAPEEPLVRDVAQRPNHYYLDNANPVDLGSVVIIRHGQTQTNREGILLGRNDSILGWSGCVLDMTPRPCPAGVESWHCSTLLRTQQTATIFGVANPIAHAQLDEMSLGIGEGQYQRDCVANLRSVELMQRGDPFAAIVDEQTPGSTVPDGECFMEVLLRVFSCLYEELGFTRNI